MSLRPESATLAFFAAAAGLVVAGCSPSPIELCQDFARRLTTRAMRCPGAPELRPGECDEVTGVRDPVSFQSGCLARMDAVACEEPLPDACNAQLRR